MESEPECLRKISLDVASIVLEYQSPQIIIRHSLFYQYVWASWEWKDVGNLLRGWCKLGEL